MKIPIAKPYLSVDERQAVLETLESGWLVQGPKVAEFERRFAEYAQTRFAVATTSCTAALHLALKVLGIQPGDEVILPAFTWVSTANVVENLGAKPVFVDIDAATFNIDVRQLEPAITVRTKAIIPVSLFGLSANMPPILELASLHGLRVVEDAACAVGSWYRDHHAGTLADIGCFSFHARKVITTGEGGILITNDERLAQQASMLRDHGASKNDFARHEGPHSYRMPAFDLAGFNYRMTDLQGALGMQQMQKLDLILGKRRTLAARYDEALSEFSWLQIPFAPDDCRHSYQAYVCRYGSPVPGLEEIESLHQSRNELMDKLEQVGIATRPGTHAVHLLTYYRGKYGFQPQDFPNSYMADQFSLALPLYAQMTVVEQDYVIDHLTHFNTPDRPPG